MTFESRQRRLNRRVTSADFYGNTMISEAA